MGIGTISIITSTNADVVNNPFNLKKNIIIIGSYTRLRYHNLQEHYQPFASTYKQNLNTTITQMIYGDNDLKKFKKKNEEFETMITNYIHDIIPNYIKVICTVINIGNVKIR